MEFSDYLEIKGILHEYPRLTDKGDFEGVGRYYENVAQYLKDQKTGAWELRRAGLSVKAGADAYAQIVRKFPDSETPKTRHLITNVVIEDEGPDRARSECYIVVLQATQRLPLQAIIAGTFFDKFARRDGRWRLVERYEDMELVGNLSEHLLAAPST
jgi:hypothetical protein